MKVVIIGAGFAGLKLARILQNKPGFEVVLIDQNNYHQFQPLFYQVATAGLDASNISFPLRKMFQGSHNLRIRMAEVTRIDPDQRQVHTTTESISYDALVLATGADTNFFGNATLQQNALPMKSTTEALQLRHQLIHRFEDALLAESEEELQRLLTIVVVGGGPTGVELSGAIAEMKRYVLPKDYPELDFTKMRILLMEAGDRTLAGMSEKSGAQSSKYLKNLGVELWTKAQVKTYDGQQVQLADGRTIDTATVIWAAGIAGNVPRGLHQATQGRGRRLVTNRYHQVEGLTHIYALGDVALMATPLFPHGHPQVANVAVTMAENLAQNLVLEEKKSSRRYAYEYYDKGSMATVGRHLAVVDIPKPRLHMGGWLAWFIWMGLHLFLLVGVKNRVMVFINWVYNYFTYDQSLRLIFREFYMHPKNQKATPQQAKAETEQLIASVTAS